MIIYNVTTQVQHNIVDIWMHWMQTIHIPQVMQTNCFVKYQFVEVLDMDESEGKTFAVQYFATDIDAYKKYINEFSPVLRQDSLNKWGQKVIGFRSLMKVL